MPSSHTNQQKLALFRDAFRGRTDIHGTRDVATDTARCVKTPPNENVMMDHLCGRQPVGIYPLVADRVWFAAIDLDEPDPQPVLALNNLARGLDLPPLIERSKSKGWHLWWFADKPGVPAWMIRRLLTWMTVEVERAGVEVFPKQDRLAPDRFGNFIFLPLDGRLVPQARTIFVEPTRRLPPVKNQWDTLSGRPRITKDQLSQVMASVGIERETSGDTPIPESEACGQVFPQNGKAKHPAGHGGFHNRETRDTQGNCHRFGGREGLPLCGRRMLTEGVTGYQRVVCFRLAIHLYRLGFPQDLALVTLRAWAQKNRPVGGKCVITDDEIAEQTACAYTGRYRGYGCEDPQIARYCGNQCPLRRNGNGRVFCNTTSGSHA